MKLWPMALVGAAATLSACADYYPPPPPPPPIPPGVASAAPLEDGCLRTRDIDNHRVADARTVYVRVANRDVFRLEMSGACLSGVGPNDPLVIRESAGQAFACRPVDLDISIARGAGGTTPCIVRSMTRLTPDEVAALPDRHRP